MTELVVRRLLIDLAQPMAQHWCGGDAFRTALFNALSMSFPMGEQFFIDAVRDGHKSMPPNSTPAMPARCAALSGKRPHTGVSMACSTATWSSAGCATCGPSPSKSSANNLKA